MKNRYKLHTLDVTAQSHILVLYSKNTKTINIGGIAGKIRVGNKVYTYTCIRNV